MFCFIRKLTPPGADLAIMIRMTKIKLASVIGALLLGAILLTFLLVKIFLWQAAPENLSTDNQSATTRSIATPAAPHNAFLSAHNNSYAYQITPAGSVSAPHPTGNTGTSSPASPAPSPAAVANTTPNNSISRNPTLPWPAVSDQEITVSSSGISSTLAYLAYFSKNIINIPVDKTLFTAGEKDASGTPLFTPELVSEITAGNGTPNTYQSLINQQKIAQAEITFLRSVAVDINIAPLDKEVIGSEELTLDLIQKALGVRSGATTIGELSQYDAEYSATINAAQTQLFQSTQNISASHPKQAPWFDVVLHWLGFRTSAQAQSASGFTPFGGQVLFTTPCPCSAGEWMGIGSPAPASIFASYAWMASPLFYQYHSLRLGAWWLGLYDPTTPVPCLSIISCATTGEGGLVITAGTSE